MSLVVVSRAALLTAASWAALAGAAAAQDGPRPTELDEVIVTGAPYGISARATTIATTVIGEEALAYDPNPDESQRQQVLRAGASCPVQAIILELDPPADRDTL